MSTNFNKLWPEKLQPVLRAAIISALYSDKWTPEDLLKFGHQDGYTTMIMSDVEEYIDFGIHHGLITQLSNSPRP